VAAERGERPLTLLVVDDEERILSALCRTLRREGYDLLTARTAEEALRMLEGRAVHMILTDQRMPGMTGIELLERASEKRPGAARMLITGWTEEIPPRELERCGICALVTKPWDDEKLKATLRRAAALVT
jgi:response regulator RpfG family c-di-GMP phosphodiesterase